MQNEILVPGNVGQIQVILSQPETSFNTTAIICHPHPLYGGTMHNKVVTTIANVLLQLGIQTLRFNFRGIGKSEGTFDKGDGESDDVVALMEWVEAQNPGNDIWLAGFSFGAYVATRVAANHSLKYPIRQLITVAPAVSNFNFVDLPAVTCPWLLIQGDKDEVVDPKAVYSWVQTLNPEPTVIRFPDAGHFFHGQLTELKNAIKNRV